MRNEHILNSRIIIFAGAGASQPFGKWLMAEFLDHLIEIIRKTEAHSKALLEVLETIISYKGKDLENILKELNDLVEKGEYLGDLTKVNSLHDILDGDIAARKRLAVLPSSGSLPNFFPSPFSKNYSQLVILCMRLRSCGRQSRGGQK